MLLDYNGIHNKTREYNHGLSELHVTGTIEARSIGISYMFMILFIIENF